jgi:Ca-activated chloride channel family protein
VEGQEQSFDYLRQRFRNAGGSDFLPRLWATRKIGALLNQVRLQGPEEELVDQIVKLSIRYGIVTPYTSYLVTEPMALSREAQEGIANEAFSKMLGTPTSVSGQDAVERAAAESEISGAEVPMAISGDVADIVRLAGAKTFRLVDGIWIDTAYDPDTMSTIKVPFLSEDYFELADARSEFGVAFALGERVIILVGDTAYEVVADSDSGDPITIPPAPSSEEDEAEEVPGLEPSPVERQSGGGVNLLCPGFAFAMGICVIPLSKARRRR